MREGKAGCEVNSEKIAALRAQLAFVERTLAGVPDDECVTIHSLEGYRWDDRPLLLLCFHDVAAAFKRLGREGWRVEGENLVKVVEGYGVAIYRAGELGRVLGFPEEGGVS